MTSRNDKIDLVSIIELAHELATRLNQDVQLASTRIEHVRVTARANEAANLLSALERHFENPETDSGV